MPMRAVSVNTEALTSVRLLLICCSHDPKKNVLFLRIGPPKLAVTSFVLRQSNRFRSRTPVEGLAVNVWLLLQVFASSAVLWTCQVREPAYRFVPERVVICICALPRYSGS